MFGSTALSLTRVVAGVALLGATMTLGLACGASSHASARAQVSAGADYTCVLIFNHKVDCWGGNANGQLGNGTTARSTAPVSVSGVTNATAIATGGLHACALLSDHKIKCWGDNSSGQLGNIKATNGSIPTTVVGITNAVQVSAGYLHTCALLSNHTVKCWGNGADGALGSDYSNASTSNSAIPLLADRGADPFRGAMNATQVSAGGDHTCALLDIRSAQKRELSTLSALSAVPVRVHRTLLKRRLRAILNELNVSCWGRNFLSDVGVPFGTMLDGAGANAVSAGGTHTCALLSDHSVACWGSNTSGQLGDGTTTNRSRPVHASGVTNAAQVSAGGNHTCALLSDQNVVCWGANDKGQLGNGTKTNSTTPVPVKNVTNAVQVSAGGSHTCALLSNERVECWGSNASGQLGDGTTTDRTTPVRVVGLR